MISHSEHLPPNWIRRLCSLISVPASPENISLFWAWQKAEGGSAKYNPLNTTFSLPGSTNYNSSGVKNYPNGCYGVAATGITLRNGYYDGIIHSMRSHKPAKQIVLENMKEFSTWGTGGWLILKVLGS
jgi:hypothetical protein